MSGNNKDAQKFLEHCIKLGPAHHIHGLSNLGSVLCYMSKFKETTPYFKQALDLADSEDKRAIIARLVDCYINLELFIKASPLIAELYGLDEEMALMVEGKMVREMIPAKKKPRYR